MLTFPKSCLLAGFLLIGFMCFVADAQHDTPTTPQAGEVNGWIFLNRSAITVLGGSNLAPDKCHGGHWDKSLEICYFDIIVDEKNTKCFVIPGLPADHARIICTFEPDTPEPKLKQS